MTEEQSNETIEQKEEEPVYNPEPMLLKWKPNTVLWIGAILFLCGALLESYIQVITPSVTLPGLATVNTLTGNISYGPTSKSGPNYYVAIGLPGLAAMVLVLFAKKSFWR